MIRKITLSNYMSHVHTTLDLAPGLTVLVGPNNCGKSAVVSALESLCRNTAGDFMIRHGAKEATVTVETDDDHVITWKRKEQTASYVIDGREVHRLGRGSLPDDLHEKLRLPLVHSEQDNVEFDVHLGHQKEPVFLLDRPASQRATFFASSSDARLLLRMQQLHRQHVQDSRSALRRAQDERTELDAQIAVLEPVDRLAALIDEADVQAQGVAQAETSIKGLHAWLDQTTRLAADSSRESARTGALEPLTSPPALHEVAAIQAVVASMSRAVRTSIEASERIAALEDVQPVPELTDTAALEGWIGHWHNAARESSRRSSEVAVLSGAREHPELDDEHPLAELIETMTARLAEVSKHAKAVGNLVGQIGQVEDEIRAWARANPTCPTCGAPIHVDEILTREHGDG